METPVYVHLEPGRAPPPLGDAAPFRAIVVVEDDVTPEWQAEVSDWLVRAGCKFMMAWGKNCSSWDDSVDDANLAICDYGEIPEDKSVMTTWHDTETLEQVFRFSESLATHPSWGVGKTYLVHVSAEAEASALLERFRYAQDSEG